MEATVTLFLILWASLIEALIDVLPIVFFSLSFIIVAYLVNNLINDFIKRKNNSTHKEEAHENKSRK
ncbi:hypothetical protein [Intestinibacter bartlettii]|uniref:hypothetical protein n=1 Tax=Intestinibacter bartlettii TaxID=261299 RepID=UPI0001A27464|nr:hypothetical protein MBAG_02803 [Coprobacillus sp. D7]